MFVISQSLLQDTVLGKGSQIQGVITLSLPAGSKKAGANGHVELVTDVSWSMTGEGMANLKPAARSLFDRGTNGEYRLPNGTTVGGLWFDDNWGVTFPPTVLTDATRRDIQRKIDMLTPNGSTRFYEPMNEAFQILEPHDFGTMIGTTDGESTVGADEDYQLTNGLMQRFNQSGKTVIILASGNSYKPLVVKRWIETAGGASFYVHVTGQDLNDTFDRISRMLAALAASNVAVEFAPAPGVDILQVVSTGTWLKKLSPNASTMGRVNVDVGAFEEGKELKLQFTLRATQPLSAGSDVPVCNVNVTYNDDTGTPQSITFTITVNVTDDINNVAKADKSMAMTFAATHALLLAADATDGDQITNRKSFTQARTIAQNLGAAGSDLLDLLDGLGDPGTSTDAKRRSFTRMMSMSDDLLGGIGEDN